MSNAPNRDSWEELYRYWLSKHVAGRPPARADIDPVIDIPNFLSNLMIIDILPEGFRYRLVGTDITERFGGELTGRAVGSSSMPANARAEWTNALNLVRSEQKPRLLVSRLPADVEANHIMLVLPLVAPSGVTERILVGIFFNNRDFRPGFQSEGLVVTELD
jgi:hypothetical protein